MTTTVTLTITNPPPVAVDDGVLQTPADGGDLVIRPVANDSDADGDPLQIVEIDGQPIIAGGPAVDVEGGTVRLEEDGETLIFSPEFGYAAPASFDYTIADNSGDRSTAEIALRVNAADGFEQYLPADDTSDPGRFGGHAANGGVAAAVGVNGLGLGVGTGREAGLPGDLAGPVVPAGPGPQSGFVLDTVANFAGAGSLVSSNTALDINLAGIIVATANDIDPLGGIAALPGAEEAGSYQGPQPVIATIIEHEARRAMAERAAETFGQTFTSWGPEGLTGFSLRQPIDTDLARDVGKVVIDTLVRDRILYVELSNELAGHTDFRVTGYRVLQGDGSPLPQWIHEAENGALIAEVPADVSEISLRIFAILNDGSALESRVVIQSATGEIQAQPFDEQRRDAETFGEQLKRQKGGELR